MNAASCPPNAAHNRKFTALFFCVTMSDSEYAKKQRCKLSELMGLVSPEFTRTPHAKHQGVVWRFE